LDIGNDIVDIKYEIVILWTLNECHHRFLALAQ